MISKLRRRHNARRSRGQSLVEFTLVLPVMLLLLLTAIDLGRLLYSQITITNAAKEGALVASQGGSFQASQACSSTNTIMCGVLTEAKGGFVQVDQTRVTVGPALCQKNAAYPPSGAPPNVLVTVQAPFRILTPIIGAFIAPNLILTGKADAQCLVVPPVTFPSLPMPTAVFTANPSSGTVPPNLTVTFDGSASSSSGSTISTYAWSFGSSGASPTATHTYTAVGTYSVTLTVTDGRGQTATSAPITITVNAPACTPVTPSFTATDKSTPGKPHRMQLTGAVSPVTSGWAWSYTGAVIASGQSPTVDFPASGPQSVMLTVTKSGCSYSSTQIVTAP